MNSLRNRAALVVVLVTSLMLGTAGIAGATPPPVDPEAEVTSLFEANFPIAVAIVLAVATSVIAFALLKAGIRKVSGAVTKL